MYTTFRLLQITIFYFAAILILLNPKSYINSKNIFSYFIVSVYCSLLIDLNVSLFTKEAIYNTYDLFIIPSIIWGSYFQKNLIHSVMFILSLILTSIILDIFYSKALIHPVIFSIFLVFMIFHIVRSIIQTSNTNYIIDLLSLTILQCFNLFFIISGYYNNIFMTINKEYLFVYYLNASIQITFYIYLIYKHSTIKNVL